MCSRDGLKGEFIEEDAQILLHSNLDQANVRRVR
jgi:hypothetical protein